MNLTTLLSQEEELVFDGFSPEDALQLGLVIVGIAKDEIKRGIAIHIETDEYPLFTHYMEGTNESNIYWVNAKKNVVKEFGHSSLYMKLHYEEQGTTFFKATGLTDAQYQAEGGSFPLIIKGKGRVGSVTVSGLTGEEDHELAVEGISRYLAM
jgi:uncharacterized protein (UPF0303 family)